MLVLFLRKQGIMKSVTYNVTVSNIVVGFQASVSLYKRVRMSQSGDVNSSSSNLRC
jgi:hypothetical protein